MHNQPSVSELVKAVKNFVDQTAMPELSGRSGFHARVASNVLGTILRDLEARESNDARERARLTALVDGNPSASLGELNTALRDKIRSGELTIQSSELMDHLKKTAIDQLKVDQPNYSALSKALEE